MTRTIALAGRTLLAGLRQARRLNAAERAVASYSTATSSAQEVSEESLWVTSKFEDVKPVIGLTVPELFREKMGPWGHLVAFECGVTGRKYTHDDVYKLSRGFAAALIKAGFRRGDTIGVVVQNLPEYPIVLFGIWEAGLIASPVNPAYTTAEIKRQLSSSGSKAVVTSEDYLVSCQAAKESNANLQSVIVIGEAHTGCHTFSEMVRTDTTGVEFCKGTQIDTVNDTCLLPYSSGTTGLPKGVMLTHTNLATNLLQVLYPDNIRMSTPVDGGEQERLVGILPFFHAYGLSCIMLANMLKGSHVMTLPKFEVKTFIDAVRKHKPTFMHLVTPLISFMVNNGDLKREDLAATHSVCGGAAPIGQSLINQLFEKYGDHILFQEGYGMTELSPVSHFLPIWTNNQKIGSCGQPIPSTLTKIVDVSTGKALPRYERGEVCIKGPQVMKGYFNNEKATKETIDLEGWLHTGDIGYYDNDSCLFIVDRLKELIKVKGFQVAPSELEDLLRSHAKVEDVAVIGVPDGEWGELPRAYLVKKANVDLSEDEIHDYIKNEVTSYKQLRGGVEFIESVPKAPSGKILRRELLLEYKNKRGLQ